MEYDQVRVQILGKDPFASLKQSYSYIQQKESHIHVMLAPTATSSRSAMTVKPSSERFPGSTKEQLRCEYCGKPRHTKEICWFLHGKPTKGKGKRNYGRTRAQAHISKAVSIVPAEDS